MAEAQVDVRAPVAVVWSALIDPDQIREYMFGSQVQTDWTVGGPILWNGEYEGRSYQDKGKVIEYDEPRRLSVTHFSPLSGQADVPENYHTLVYTLAEDGENTRVTLSQDNNASEEEAEHSKANWQQMLQGLKSHVEGAGPR